MIKKIIFSLVIFISIELVAQRPGGSGGGMLPEGIVKGVISDSHSGKPMEYANIVLFNVRDSSMVTGGVTASDGSFELEKIPFGRFYLEIYFIGFNRLTIGDIRVTPNNKLVNLGLIKLDPAMQSLEAVEVTAEKQHIEFQIDKKVVNVSQDLMAQGGTAVNALENTPSVTVDVNGDVSLRGSSNFLVLVDGRPSVLQGSDALQQIPASNIDRIEIITNPSAKFDPDGSAGIINVILKQKKESGVNGIFNLSVGTKKKFNTDFLLNYRQGKFNFFAGAGYRDFNSGGRRKSIQEAYLNDTTRYLFSAGDRKMHRTGYNLRGGIEYFMTDKTYLSFNGEYGEFDFSHGFTSHQEEYTSPESLKRNLLTQNNSTRERAYYRLSLNSQHKFDEKGQQIEVMVNYSDNTNNSFEDQSESLTDENWQIIDPNPYKIKTLEPGEGTNWRFKVDYVNPLSEKAKLETGYQARIEQSKDDYDFMFWDMLINEWIENPLYSNKMEFDNDIHSIYGIYSDQTKKFGYQVGLRTEYNYRRIINLKSETPALIDRWDFFPTLHLSKTFDNNDQIQASYTRRINRPRGWSLDPFVMYIDAYNRRRGNPNLKPELTDSYELAFQKRKWGSLFSFEAYYRYTTDKITRIRTLESDGTFLYTFENVNNDYSLGTELMVNTSLWKWFELNVTGNLFHYRIKGDLEGNMVDNESMNWNIRTNAMFKLPHDFRLQINTSYNGPSITAQGTMEGFFMSSIALRKELFDRKLSISASMQDILKTAKWENTSSGIGFYSKDIMKPDFRFLMFNLSYKINNYKRHRFNDQPEMQNTDMNVDDF